MTREEYEDALESGNTKAIPDYVDMLEEKMQIYSDLAKRTLHILNKENFFETCVDEEGYAHTSLERDLEKAGKGEYKSYFHEFAINRIKTLEAELSRRDEEESDMLTIVKFGCHCDLEEGMEPDGCVIDENDHALCIYAKEGMKKEDCEYWRQV